MDPAVDNISHLRHLGFKPGNCADSWKKYFKRAIKGYCKCCSAEISITRLIASIIQVKYYGRNVVSPVYFILAPTCEEQMLPGLYSLLEANNYYAGITNKQKVDLLIPVCSSCWTTSINQFNYSNIGFMITNNQPIDMVD